MLDRNGRPIEVGDIIATPYDGSNLTHLPERIKDAILGKVIEVFAGDDHDEMAHIGDGIIYEASEIVTLSGLEFVTCAGCGFTWPFDVRMNTKEECPDCGALLNLGKCHEQEA